MSKIVLRDLIISSKYYKEKEAKELLEVITAERLETEQQQKLEQQWQLTIEKLRFEIELSGNVNQSAVQNNGQTSRGILMMGLREVKGTIVKREVLMVIGVNSRLGRKSPIICFLGKFLKKQKSVKLKKLTCFTCGSDKHFRWYCPKNKGVDNKRLNVNKASTERTELEDGTVAARVDLLGKVIPRQAIEDKQISENIYQWEISPCAGGFCQVNVVHQQVLCALADVLLPPDVLDMLGGGEPGANRIHWLKALSTWEVTPEL
ncbi:CCHC-type domain-containing protein [Nephila pilipes]|uniref:CCHC-type domain-containing protein n=1 Tax=Nephila pilipes TaxID=299642 RepID=A0A8X6NFX6_NEPPI|nr:CCHC-type domain-containing protein [Nephila pilipes]